MRASIRTVSGAAVAASLCIATPAAASSGASVQPWLLLSAFASPQSSKELCKQSGDEASGAAKDGKNESERGCVLPVPPAAQAAVGSGYAAGATAAVNALPLLAGLATLAGITAFVLSKSGGRDRIEFPLSPS